MPVARPLPKIPTISFFAPHWELVLRDKLALGLFGVKTRKDEKYSHRGLVLCYTSLGSHKGPMRSYGFAENNIPRGVVGCANVVGVRELYDHEKAALFGAYNNFAWDHALSYTGRNCVAQLARNDRGFADAIYPMDCGYLMQPVHRFKKPFVPHKQYMFGPLGNIPLFPEIKKQLPTWAKQLI